MSLHVRDGGAWKEVEQLHVKDGGVIKEVETAYVRDGGEWKEFFAALLTLSFVDADHDNSAAPTIPATATAIGQDLLIFVHRASKSGSAPAAAYGDGFVPLGTQTWSSGSNHYRWSASVRIAAEDDAGAAIEGATSGIDRWACMVVRASRAVSAIGALQGENWYSGNGNPGEQTVPASASELATCAIALGAGSSSAVDSLTLTGSDFSEQDGSAYALTVQNPPGADLTADMNDHGTNGLWSFYFEVA